MAERLAFGYGISGHDGETPSHDGGTPPPPLRPDRAPDVVPDRTAVRRDWAFVGLMCFTALLFFRPQDELRVLNPLHLAELSAIMALIALVVGRLGRGLPITRMTPELVGVVALGSVIILTAPFSIWIGGAVGTFTDLFVKVLLIFVLMVNTLLTPKRVEQFAWLIVLASGYIAFRAVFDYVRGVNLIESGRVRGAVGGIFGNPNDLALNMVAVMPIALSFVFRRISTFRRTLAAGCAFLMFLAIVASQSRSGTLGLAAATVVLAMLMLKRRPGLIAAGVVLVILSLPMLPSSYWERMASITDETKDETASRQARSTLMRESYNTFLEHPLTGVGAGQFKNYKPEGRVEAWRESHNSILQVASELGILGLGVYGFLMVRGAYVPIQVRRMLKRTEAQPAKGDASGAPDLLTPADREMLTLHATAMSAAFAGWFVCSLFASVAYHWTFYYILALAMAPREYLMDRLAATRPARRARVSPGIAVEARA